MTDIPVVDQKRCELDGCDTTWNWRQPGGRRKFCTPHQGRPWHELRIARIRAGLTVRQLADKAGMPPTYVHHLQQGQRPPGVQHIAALAHALGVSERLLTPHADTVVPDDLTEHAPTKAAG